MIQLPGLSGDGATKGVPLKGFLKGSLPLPLILSTILQVNIKGAR